MKNKLFDASVIKDTHEATDFITNVLQASTEYSIIGKDLDGKILLWNEGARRIYGYEPDEVVSKVNSSILHIEEDVKAGKPHQIMEVAVHHGKWESKVYGWICLKDKLDAMLFSERDEEIALTLITQAALAYENILLVERLKNSNESKSMFIANISHELRTPLNILLSSAQLLNSYIRNDVVLDRGKIMKKINVQVQNCYRLLRLVNNLIDITKIDSDHFDLNPAKCNIVEIVEAITQSVVEYARMKEIDMVFDTEEEEMLLVCDLDSIERIILNLLSNAIKFTPEGGNIQVSLKKYKSCVQISVRDTGIGICKDKLEVIFERFKQVDNLMTRKHEGSGIGLSLVKLLTELHGGIVHVYSEYQKGSEFIVELPISLTVKNDILTETKSFGEDVIKRIQIEFSDIYF